MEYQHKLMVLGARDTSVSDKSLPVKVRSNAFHVFVIKTFNTPINVSWTLFNIGLGVRYDLSRDSWNCFEVDQVCIFWCKRLS